MPWRGPERAGEFPTLGYEVADWIEASCAIPDGDHVGEPYELTDEQLRFLLWHYRLRPTARAGMPPSSAWAYRRSQLVRPQKWGKGPLSSGMICAEAEGPVLFDGWDANGDPVGRPWATPWIQVTAVSEDQTDNVWRSLLPMIELGALKADVPDTGLTRINLPGGGIIEPVTASARSRLGQRITFAVQDETHSWLERNGGIRLADNQRRNLAGMGGRSIETTNAWDPAERSVAQLTFESKLPDVHIDYPTPAEGSIRSKRDRTKIFKRGYGDSWWVDLARIDADAVELIKRGDPAQAERFFANRIVAGADAAFDLDEWAACARSGATIPKGALVTAGFDGARRKDATGIVITEVATGLQVVHAVWHQGVDFEDEIDDSEVDEAMVSVFDYYDVWRLYGDPPYWEDAMDRWAGRWGADKVVAWATYRKRPMAAALRAFYTSISTQALGHVDDERYNAHIRHARKKTHPGMVDDDGIPLWTIEKDRHDSPDKIDLVMAGCLSWEARGDAVAAGALTKKPRRRTFGSR